MYILVTVPVHDNGTNLGSEIRTRSLLCPKQMYYPYTTPMIYNEITLYER